MALRHPFERKHKYGVSAKDKRTVDGIVFDSMKEAERYADLKIGQLEGGVLFFLRQIPFHLPGKTRYVCDFVVFWENGDVTFEDVKGMRTEVYKLKKRQVEELYPITITEI